MDDFNNFPNVFPTSVLVFLPNPVCPLPSDRLFKKDFIYSFDREHKKESISQRVRGRDRGRGISRLPTEQVAQCGTRSHDPGIMT